MVVLVLLLLLWRSLKSTSQFPTTAVRTVHGIHLTCLRLFLDRGMEEEKAIGNNYLSIWSKVKFLEAKDFLGTVCRRMPSFFSLRLIIEFGLLLFIEFVPRSIHRTHNISQMTLYIMASSVRELWPRNPSLETTKHKQQGPFSILFFRSIFYFPLQVHCGVNNMAHIISLSFSKRQPFLRSNVHKYIKST